MDRILSNLDFITGIDKVIEGFGATPSSLPLTPDQANDILDYTIYNTKMTELAAAVPSGGGGGSGSVHTIQLSEAVGTAMQTGFMTVLATCMSTGEVTHDNVLLNDIYTEEDATNLRDAVNDAQTGTLSLLEFMGIVGNPTAFIKDTYESIISIFIPNFSYSDNSYLYMFKVTISLRVDNENSNGSCDFIVEQVYKEEAHPSV